MANNHWLPWSHTTANDCLSLVTTFFMGQCHEIFCFWFFSWISFSLSPEYSINTVSNFSKIRGNICKSRCTTGINNTGGKFATGVNDAGNKIAAGINNTGGKFFHQFR